MTPERLQELQRSYDTGQGFFADEVQELLRTAKEAVRLRAACEATLAWFWAEHEMPKTMTFQDRMELCNYSEWITEQAVHGSNGEAYKGVPRVFAWPRVEISREDQEQAQARVDRVLASYRAAMEARNGSNR